MEFFKEKKSDNPNLRKYFECVIISAHKHLADKLSDWIVANYPICVCNLYKRISRNSCYDLDQNTPEFIIFDLSLCFRKDIKLIQCLEAQLREALIIVMTSFSNKILEEKLSSDRIITVYPKWKIIKRLPLIIDNYLLNGYGFDDSAIREDYAS